MFFITTKYTVIFIVVAACSSPARYLAKPEGKDLADDDSSYYGLCAPFQCGGINFTFPFSNSTIFGTGPRDCGLPRFQIICNVASDEPSIELAGRLYRVKYFFPDPSERAITLVDTDLVNYLTSGSCKSLHNLTIDMMSSPIANLSLPSWNLNDFAFNFFVCPKGLSLSQEFLDAAVINRSCAEGDDDLYLTNSTDFNKVGQSGVETPEGCRRVEVPVSDAISSASLWNKSEPWDLVLTLLGDGFPLTWSDIPTCTNCQNKGGRCGYDDSVSVKTVCFSKDANQENKSTKLKRGVVIGITSGCSSVAILVALSFLICWKRVRLIRSNKDQQPTRRNNIDAESFIKTYQSTMLRSYSYKEIKKMTDSFKEKLGQGGYGSVYKGQLSDGRLVAVKILDQSNHEAQDFINEVSTIGRIHHFHIIHLLGFCLEGSKQALIYEFMPNGSLGDMLQHKEGTQFCSLGIEKVLEITIGIARGIQNLHIGCESRILHLDIKPQNILIDQNLNPKISDFGLAKMYARNKSTARFTTGARGTIGYIAPEIFMRNIGNPSDRSDVYSFGMLLLAIVGKRKGDEEWKDSKSSEAYFPSWIYDKFIDQEPEEVEEVEVSVLRKMAMVGLWCIQMNPRDRPSMTKVIEMLSGGVEAIESPPKPLFFSPPPVQLDTQNLIPSNVDSTDSLPLTKVDNSLQEICSTARVNYRCWKHCWRC